MKWYLNLKTSVKLISSFLIVSLIMAFVGIYALLNLQTMNQIAQNLYYNNLMPVKDLSAAQIDYEKSKIRLRDISLTQSKEKMDSYNKEINDLRKDVISQIDTYRNTKLTKPEIELLKVLDDATSEYFKQFDTALKLAYLDDPSEFTAYKDGPLNVAESKFRDALVNLVNLNIKIADETNDSAETVYASTRTTTIVIIVVAVILSLIFGIVISQIIVKPLRKIVAIVGLVAEGDLRQKSDIVTKDEIGQLSTSINHMVSSLQSLIGGIVQSSQSVAAASEQISASTEEIASGSTTQSRDARIITELFQELSDAINTVAVSAEGAAELSTQAVNTATAGSRVLEASIEGMEVVNKKVTLLESDSEKIGEIIEVIDDIAQQTNLLALNAAIEAARAGEQGRGFAVVADEVRKLAERSGEATKQITSIIKTMQENTKASVQAVLDSVAQTQQTGAAFREIVEKVNETSNMVNEIAAASEEQAAQSTEVINSAQSIAAASEEAAAAAEETAATSQSLAEQADLLNSSISQFKI
ncbi:methyl-accepting chemotaxis protein [Paenibacillus whitsoniae]|uniref:Methyl-accepting chemotaxis protein n=1 Tax=Paenibacillus whitsoniae TaxID=2496558 RepID=A0A430JJ01_9BACL|nr:methyl-accepting chemotaxis protein [Paenibacillus whitsoniae]RTE10983.1 methyl-accepting chemotaxis protein [Paenibacillus whitsoniae]